MSRITDVLLVADGLVGAPFEALVEEIGHWRYQERRFRLVSLEAPALPPLWYGGDRPLSAGLALGALNNLDLEPYLAFLRRLPWDEHPCTVQLLVNEEGADHGFSLYPIYPLERLPPDPRREQLLAGLAAQFGPPLPDGLAPAPDVAALDEACRQYLESRGYKLSR